MAEVEEAERAIAAGYAGRLVLEMLLELTFGVLSPAFKGRGGSFAAQGFANRGCTFYHQERCELIETGLQPLECRFCHHDRPRTGLQCHADLERDWNTPNGCGRVVRRSKLTGVWELIVLGRRK